MSHNSAAVAHHPLATLPALLRDQEKHLARLSTALLCAVVVVGGVLLLGNLDQSTSQGQTQRQWISAHASGLGGLITDQGALATAFSYPDKNVISKTCDQFGTDVALARYWGTMPDSNANQSWQSYLRAASRGVTACRSGSYSQAASDFATAGTIASSGAF